MEPNVVDMVNRPLHYAGKVDHFTLFVRGCLLEDDVDPVNIECIEAMISMLSIEELRGYFRGNSLKYRWRYRLKNGIEDLRKAEWYDKKLLKLEAAILEWKEMNNYHD